MGFIVKPCMLHRLCIHFITLSYTTNCHIYTLYIYILTYIYTLYIHYKYTYMHTTTLSSYITCLSDCYCCRSGSTLLETMLDSHSRVWGMGEDSIFNANLTAFRNALVATPPGLPGTVHTVLYGLSIIQYDYIGLTIYEYN